MTNSNTPPNPVHLDETVRNADPQACPVANPAGISSPGPGSTQPPLLQPTPTNPHGDHPQSPQPQLLLPAPSPLVDTGRLSPNPTNPEPGAGVSSNATGPKTEAGKSRSSQNAVTHGLRAKKIENAVPHPMRSEYEKLRRQFLDDYKPAGAIESTLLDMVIFAAWQLYKIRDMETFTGIDMGMPGSFGRSEKLARYRGSQERLFFRSLNQLKQIQQERAFRDTNQKAALPAHISPGVRTKPLHELLKRLHRQPHTKIASVSTLPQKPSSLNVRPKMEGSGPVSLRP